MFRVIQTLFLDLLFPPTCQTCGRGGKWLCQTCLSEIKPIRLAHPITGVDYLYCLGNYDHAVLEKSVRQLKYSGGRVLAQPLAQRLAQNFHNQLQADVLVPVPLHPSRKRMRGFNQATLLAEGISRITAVPVHVLVQRIRKTVPQVQLSGHERRNNVKNAFDLASGVAQVPKYGIVVDDVFTTGATISEVSRVLRAAGMKHITALTVAKG